MKEYRRKCFKCGSSPIDDPETTLFRFPKPGLRKNICCALWAHYCCPDKPWSNKDFQLKLHTEHRMLCHRHFSETAFVDFPSKKLRRFASPDFKFVNKRIGTIVKFYELDNSNPNYVFASSLKQEHLNPNIPNTKHKMRVKLAVQVLSHTVAVGMFAKISQGQLTADAAVSSDTVSRMDKLYDTLNSDTVDLKKNHGRICTKNKGVQRS